MDRIFSGIQPSGEIHIGNYVGAIRNWAQLINRYDCVYCVVDYHAITIEYEAALMQQRILETATVLVACGLTPDRCKLFVQSHVPEHMELTWIFNCVTPVGELERMTQFKERESNIVTMLMWGFWIIPFFRQQISSSIKLAMCQ